MRHLHTTLIFFSSSLPQGFHRVLCRGLSRDGEQSPARSDPPAPGPPAHKLLLPAGRQHFPSWPAAGTVRPQRGADHAHEPLDSWLPAHSRTEVDDHGDGSRPGSGRPPASLPGDPLHSRGCAALPPKTRRRCTRRPLAAQGQAEVWLRQPGPRCHSGGPAEGCGSGEVGVGTRGNHLRAEQAVPGKKTHPGQAPVQNQKGIYLQVLRQAFHQVLQPPHPREDPHRRAAVYLWYLPQGLQKTRPSQRPQVRPVYGTFINNALGRGGKREGSWNPQQRFNTDRLYLSLYSPFLL